MCHVGQLLIRILGRHLRYQFRRLEDKLSFRSDAFVSGSVERRARAVLACFCYAACSILLTPANKAIFSENKLNFPWMLLGLQSVVVSFVLLIFFSLQTDDDIINNKLLRQMFLPCMLLTLIIFTNARALRYISLPILTVVKSLAPMGVAITQRLIFKENVSLETYASMFLILSGNAITVLHDMDFCLMGYVWAGINVVMNVAYVVSLRYCISSKFTSAEKTIHSNLLACTFIFLLAALSSEMSEFCVQIGKTPTRFRVLFLLSCLLAAGISTSVFMVIKTTSGSTLSFVGASNKVFVVILGALLFDTSISPTSWVGFGMGTVVSIMFALSKARGVAMVAKRPEQHADVSLTEQKGNLSTALEVSNSSNILSDLSSVVPFAQIP